MSLNRKKHSHPPLVPPRSERSYTFSNHEAIRVKGDSHENDNGKIIKGRVYTYHPTKGWRNRSAKTVVGGAFA